MDNDSFQNNNGNGTLENTTDGDSKSVDNASGDGILSEGVLSEDASQTSHINAEDNSNDNAVDGPALKKQRTEA